MSINLDTAVLESHGLVFSEENCAYCGRAQVGSVLNVTKPEEWPYFDPKKPTCIHCIYGLEETYIKKMPVNDLPLWIGKEWSWGSNQELFQKRLKKSLGVKA